jgi:Prokaryotic phospholipase A2
MRTVLAVLVAVTSFLTVPSPADAGPVAADPAADLRRIEQLLYRTALADFVAAVSNGESWLDVSTDLCSAPLVGSSGRSFDFTIPCRRHDFGYRNLQLLDRRYSCPHRPVGQLCPTPGRFGTYWNRASRRRVDAQLLTDMRAHCRSRPRWDRPTCLTWAQTFYTAVRVAGGP